jgi:hypothetical protein
MMRQSYWLRRAGTLVLGLLAVMVLQGCSKAPEQPAQPAAAPPPPTTGSVDFHLMDAKTQANIAGTTVYLCEAGEASKCTLRAALTGTSGQDGTLRMSNVKPGRYFVAFAGAKTAGAVTDGMALDFAARDTLIMAGSSTDISDEGKPIVTGGLKDVKTDLRVVAKKGKLLEVEVRAGETAAAHAAVPAHALK